MFYILLTVAEMPETQSTLDYVSQIIGVLGTILGTILGWLLHLISENVGRTYIYCDSFKEQKSKSDEYAYIAKIFIYNASHKQQSIRNVRFRFVNGKGDILFESTSAEGKCSFETVRSKIKNKSELLCVGSGAQEEYFFCDLINEKEYKQMSKVKKIILVYEDKKNHTKKRVIKRKFNISDVKWCEGKGFL